MTKHLFGVICTHSGTAANNRGETEGNVTTLQKLLWNGAVHTTVSSEAIRWAIRQRWQARGIPTNRRWDEDTRRHNWQDRTFRRGEQEFIDDDVLGYMSAEASKEEGEKGTALVRRSRLEVARAVSLTPWAGDITFNAASIGATPSAAMRGENPVPYGAEMHATRYQFGFALTPESLSEPARATDAINAIIELGDVAGNHARFLFDFSPESVVFRWTDDFAPRILYGFDDGGSGAVGASKVVRAVESRDVPAAEIIVGGALADTPDGRRLVELGAAAYKGVREAEADLLARVRSTLGLSG